VVGSNVFGYVVRGNVCACSRFVDTNLRLEE